MAHPRSGSAGPRRPLESLASCPGRLWREHSFNEHTIDSGQPTGRGPRRRRGQHRPHRVGRAVAGVPAAGRADQRRQGADRPAEAADRDRLPVRRSADPGRPRRHRLLVQQARRRAGAVRACQGDRAEPDRRRPERHRAAVGQAVLGRRLGGPQRPGDAGHRGLRHRAVGLEGQAREAAAGQAARRAPRQRALLQHLGRLPVDAACPRC